MVEWNKFYKSFTKLEDYLNKKAPQILIKKQKEIVELNNKQLSYGQGIDGSIMQTGYSKGYSKLRQKKGLQTAYVDLKFTGKYQKTRKGKKADGGINIISDADYEKYLRGNFPDHIGLTKINAITIKEMIKDEVTVLIKKYLTQ